MRILWCCLLFHTVFAQTGFGTSYLRNSRLCHQWNCLNEKLGLPDALPPKGRYAAALKSLLPEGPWQDAVAPTLDVCYGARPRRYTNTCPGQALMQCTVEQLIENCPEQSWVKEDACAPISSLAGFKYLFSQSRYENLEKNLPSERRLSWFLTNYFNSKCCNLPEFFNSTVMTECGVDTFMHYYIHSPQRAIFPSLSTYKQTTVTPVYAKETLKIVELPKINAPRPTEPTNNGDALKIVDIPIINTHTPLPTEPTNTGEALKIVDIPIIHTDIPHDPLDCCDVTEFLQPSWREECNFQLSWGKSQERLMIKDQGQVYTTAAPTTTTTISSVKHHDVKIVPLDCEKENCIFKNLNIVSESGVVDKDAFSKLLDNMTSVHRAWTKAKARVVTKCLSRPIVNYEADCEINKVLACTFDVLTENCPYAEKADPCRHSSVMRENISCQISSSKYRPKNRRQFCGIPNMVNSEVLSQCEAKSMTRMEYVPDSPVIKSRKHVWLTPKTYMCQETTESTQCIMRKMDVLNKYGFMDYFKMKDKIRQFAEGHIQWASLKDVYLSAFLSTPVFYREHCNSPKKFLNVVDSMLMTCPASRKKQSPQCNKMFSEISSAPFDTKQNVTQEQVNQIIQYLQKIFLHKNKTPPRLHPKFANFKPKHNLPVSSPKKELEQTTEPYGFSIFSFNDPPPVKTVTIKPSIIYKKPLLLLPVYKRPAYGAPGKMNLSLRPYNGVFRSAPYLLHNMSMAYNATFGGKFTV